MQESGVGMVCDTPGMKCLQWNVFRDRKYISDCQGLGVEGEWGVTANGHGVSFWGDVYVLRLAGSDSCATL